ncbi:hypothetical protein NHH03_15070 [Stieleria sp. TO1_6]|uniref:hypothetical protein n=1 Tax=Stieleria tagensis TaxID=2956795 RepID=UPI00209B377B|nr:hypothetical protein [Stieleria tagensis]MCO8123067.1 hypothetical protein [Stieleria tagensis]
MNNLSSSRSLLLEQLESRCLLAAEFVSLTFTNEGASEGAKRQHDNAPPSESAVTRSAHDTQQGQVDRQHHHGSDPPGLDRPARNDGGLLDRPQGSREPTPQPPASTLPPPGGESLLPEPVSPTLPQPVPNPDSTGVPSLPPDRPPLSLTSFLPAPQQSDTADSELRAFASVTTVVHERLNLDPITKSATATTERPMDQSIWSESDSGGVIEIQPLSNQDPLSPDNDELEKPWEIDIASIDQLRRTADLSIDSADRVDRRQTDAVIASWFGQQTGFIDVHADGVLSPIEPLTPSVVDVVLDATVGLHRSVDLIADTTDQSPISDDVRLAILNAIAAEHPFLPAVAMNQTIRSSGKSTFLSATTIASPVAVALVTSIAVAARSRRSGAAMESTRTMKSNTI